ncbi:MAG: putative minor capsid protein [Microviridae sp. ctYqV29]|nr:MAG: putative minor capsid protein [Microviridae sp. ctYqV29]
MWEALGSVAGSLLGGLFGSSEADRQADLQKEFAQKGIQWKVADAKKAGIHPLYALGAPTMSYSPITTGMGDAIQNAGQSLGRAVDANLSAGERLDGFTKASQALQLERGKLENELLKVKIASETAVTAGQLGPAAPSPESAYLIPGQGQTVLKGRTYNQVQTDPLKRQSVSSVSPNQEAGAIAEAGFMRTPTGYAPIRSKDAMDRMDDDWAGSLAWNLRNRLLPMWDSSGRTPPIKLRKGYYWYWNPVLQEYQVAKRIPESVTDGPSRPLRLDYRRK